MKENEFYVYVYLSNDRPGEFKYDDISFDFEPFYIGKGKGNRYRNHLFKSNKTNLSKLERISELNKEPIIIKLYENLTHEEAVDKEKQLIKKIGRINLSTGPLTNQSDGGEGFLNFKHTKEYKDSISKKIIQYDINGNILSKYNSIKEASEFLNIGRTIISQSCRYEIKIVKDKWIFLYEGDPFVKRIRGKYEVKIIRTDIYGNSIIYDSVTDASIKNNTTQNNIIKVCVGSRLVHLGYYWDYINKKIDKTKLIDDFSIKTNRLIQKDLLGNTIKIYNNIFDAYIDLDIRLHTICKNIQGIYKNAGIYSFEYEV